MNWAKHVDIIVAIVSLLLIASGGILYFSQSGLQFLSEIIILIGFILLIFSALGGKGEKEGRKEGSQKRYSRSPTTSRRWRRQKNLREYVGALVTLLQDHWCCAWYDMC